MIVDRPLAPVIVIQLMARFFTAPQGVAISDQTLRQLRAERSEEIPACAGVVMGITVTP